MAASSFYSLMLPPRIQTHFSRRPPSRRARSRGHNKPPRKFRATWNHEDIGDHREHEGGGVDENMKTLRQSIRAIKAMDRGDVLLEEWMEWEKLYHHTFFQSNSCEILGFLQLDPVHARPSLAIGVTVMVRLSIPISVLVVMLCLMDAAKEILDHMHLNDEGFTNH
ncbi:putative Mediator of RNA polymerase II transcription subunit [Cocos nucifera]|nr:putative Mediator of RNA polymerase II transcription subunit [Cocos nucifera]